MRDLQSRLAREGFNPGPVDGAWGPRTKAAALGAMDELARLRGAQDRPAAAVPSEWMPVARMQRVIAHWTGGTHIANATDRLAYHLLIEGDGKLVRGIHPISANERVGAAGTYAAHAGGANTGSIGVALCGMRGAREAPFSLGTHPINEGQWQALVRVLADLCRAYGIEVGPTTVLTHAEVRDTLRAGGAKWDISLLPWDNSVRGARQVGDRLRAMVREAL